MMNLVMRSVMIASVVVGSATAHAQTTVSPRTYGPYCPSHIGGDREYNGHGPEVDASITLYRANGNRDIRLSFFMHQIETVSNWSEAQLERDVRIATAPANTTYTAAFMPLNGVWQWAPLGAASEIGVADINYTDTDHSADVFSNPAWFVGSVRIIGDTGGNDIGNCTNDDASFQATFPALAFWYQ